MDVVYLLGLLLFARPTMLAVDDIREANKILSNVWIDLLGTVLLMLWPLTFSLGIVMLLRGRR